MDWGTRKLDDGRNGSMTAFLCGEDKNKIENIKIWSRPDRVQNLLKGREKRIAVSNKDLLYAVSIFLIKKRTEAEYYPFC